MRTYSNSFLNASANNAGSINPRLLLSGFSHYYLVAMATYLDRSENKVTVAKTHSYGETSVEMGPVYPKIFDWIRQFLLRRTRSIQMSSVNSGVTRQKFTKFLHDIEALFMLLMCSLVALSHSVSECQRTSEGSLPFFQKIWLTWQRPLRYLKKRTRLIICTQNALFGEEIAKKVQ